MKKCPSIQEANVSLFFFVEITFLWMEIKHLSKIIPSDILYTACINPDCSNLMAKRKERYSCFVNCDVDKDFKFYFLILHKLFKFLVWGLFNFFGSLVCFESQSIYEKSSSMISSSLNHSIISYGVLDLPCGLMYKGRADFLSLPDILHTVQALKPVHWDKYSTCRLMEHLAMLSLS